MPHPAKGVSAMKRAMLPVVREPVGHFARRMEERLRRHDADRGERGWIGTDREWLVSRVMLEISEVQYAMLCQSHEDVANECADAANFLMMIADQCRPMNFVPDVARPVPRSRRKAK